MQTQQPDEAASCACATAVLRGTAVPLAVPQQLSFLSPIAHATADVLPSNPYADDPDDAKHARYSRKRRACSLKPSDVPDGTRNRDPRCNGDSRALLRKPTGEYLPPLFARIESSEGASAMIPADAATILDSADALLAWRFRRGVTIFKDPHLLLNFLRIRLVRQPRPVFAAFFLDRKQRLIDFSEIARGEDDRVKVHPKELIRDALWWHAEQVLCVRSDPRGDHQPTTYDIEDARRVKHALDLVEPPLVDYVIVGESITSLVHRRVI
jgi:DNA repair protein RadC